MNTQQKMQQEQMAQSTKNTKPSVLLGKSDNNSVSFKPICDGADVVKIAEIQTDNGKMYNIAVLGKPILKIEEMPTDETEIETMDACKIMEMCARIYLTLKKIDEDAERNH